MKNNIVTPAYHQIALNIAEKVVKGQYVLGEKLYGRSTLAAHYGVSPETIRKAVYILKDVGILSITKGSGIEIISIDNAFKFVDQYQNIKKIGHIKKNITEWINIQMHEHDLLLENVKNLLDITQRYDEINPFTPFMLHLTSEMNYLGNTISEIAFWQHTGATIIAIKRNNDIILSPGPYATFNENDILFFIGQVECLERVKKLFLKSV